MRARAELWCCGVTAARIRSPSLAERQANRTAEPQYVRLDLAPLLLLVRQECLMESQSARQGLQKSVGVTRASSEPELRASSHSCTTRLANLSLVILYDLWPLFSFLRPPIFFKQFILGKMFWWLAHRWLRSATQILEFKWVWQSDVPKISPQDKQTHKRGKNKETNASATGDTVISSGHQQSHAEYLT